MASNLIPLESPEFLAEDRRGQLIGTSITAIVLTTIVLGTRFFAKRFQGGGFFYDDGFLVAAYIVNLGMCALGIGSWETPSSPGPALEGCPQQQQPPRHLPHALYLWSRPVRVPAWY